MGHKNLIGGTAYETAAGRCLVSGTAYDVKKGRTLVGGTGYDVSFTNTVRVTITDGDKSLGYVTINGTKYTSGVVDVEVGSTIDVYASAGYSNLQNQVTIKVFGTQVKKGAGTYTYDTADYPDTDITVKFTYTTMSAYKIYHAAITAT